MEATQTPRPPRAERRGVRRHERRRPTVNAARDELIRRGLPARRAVRYARELQAHWEDLFDERLASGAAQSVAETEADERLGSVGELVSAAVRQHRRESFAGRHRVFSCAVVPFALVPFALIAFLLLVVLPLGLMFGESAEDDDSAQSLPPLTAQQEKRAWRFMMTAYVLCHAWNYAVPAGLAVVCHRSARRRTLSGRWAWTAAAAVAVGGGLQRVNLGWYPGDRPAMLSLGYGRWPEPSVVAVVLASAALAAWVMHRNKRPLAPHVVQ